MHKFLRAAGVSMYQKKRDIVSLLELLEKQPSLTRCVELDSETNVSEMRVEVAPGIGISIIGEINEEGKFEREFYLPYLENMMETKEPAAVGELVRGKNKEHTKNGTAVIPVGFAIVPGLDDVSKGLVISDVANDTGNVGNQFVWIPVNKTTFASKFKRVEGYWNKELDSKLSNCGEANGNGINSKITEDTTVVDEAKLMYASVLQNGGFYIGRYEAGTTATSGSGIRGNLVVKKGAQVYNNIGWSDSNTMTDVTGGAVEVARGMYKGKKTEANENYGVTSTLCYGVQWDAALNFIDSNYITKEVQGKPNCSLDSYLVDSTAKGWYTDNYNLGNSNHLTGVDLNSEAKNKVKNIYDMAGNVREWTMEAYSSYARVSRGR